MCIFVSLSAPLFCFLECCNYDLVCYDSGLMALIELVMTTANVSRVASQQLDQQYSYTLQPCVKTGLIHFSKFELVMIRVALSRVHNYLRKVFGRCLLEALIRTYTLASNTLSLSVVHLMLVFFCRFIFHSVAFDVLNEHMQAFACSYDILAHTKKRKTKHTHTQKMNKQLTAHT